MTSDEKRAHLRGLRAHLDARCPGWRDAVDADGRTAERIEFYVELADGSELRLTLHQQPEPVTTTGEGGAG